LPRASKKIVKPTMSVVTPARPRAMLTTKFLTVNETEAKSLTSSSSPDTVLDRYEAR